MGERGLVLRPGWGRGLRDMAFFFRSLIPLRAGVSLALPRSAGRKMPFSSSLAFAWANDLCLWQRSLFASRKWAREDSNLQALRHTVLSRARIPIPPLALHLRQAGIEPATYCFEGNRSIQLSYWRRLKMRREGIEPSTLTLRVSCSAN